MSGINISDQISELAKNGNINRLHLFLIISVAATVSAIFVIYLSGTYDGVDWADAGVLLMAAFVAVICYGAIWVYVKGVLPHK